MEKLSICDSIDLINTAETVMEVACIKDDFMEYNFKNPTVYTEFERAIIDVAITKRMKVLIDY